MEIPSQTEAIAVVHDTFKLLLNICIKVTELVNEALRSYVLHTPPQSVLTVQEQNVHTNHFPMKLRVKGLATRLGITSII